MYKSAIEFIDWFQGHPPHEKDNNNNNDIKIIHESSPVCLLHSKVPIIISAHDLRVVYAWPNLKSALLYVNMAKGDKINNQITSIQLMSIYLATSGSRLSSPPQLLILTPLKGPCARYSRCRIKRHCLGWRWPPLVEWFIDFVTTSLHGMHTIWIIARPEAEPTYLPGGRTGQSRGSGSGQRRRSALGMFSGSWHYRVPDWTRTFSAIDPCIWLRLTPEDTLCRPSTIVVVGQSLYSMGVVIWYFSVLYWFNKNYTERWFIWLNGDPHCNLRVIL